MRYKKYTLDIEHHDGPFHTEWADTIKTSPEFSSWYNYHEPGVRSYDFDTGFDNYTHLEIIESHPLWNIDILLYTMSNLVHEDLTRTDSIFDMMKVVDEEFYNHFKS